MTTGLAELEARIRRLEDIEEIRRLRMHYHYSINEGMPERVGDIFTKDAHVEYTGVGSADGQEESRALVVRLGSQLTIIKQFISNHMVDVDGDTATGVAYLDARYAYNNASVIAAAVFKEKYRRTPEGWKMSEMVCTPYFATPITEGWAKATQTILKPS